MAEQLPLDEWYGVVTNEEGLSAGRLWDNGLHSFSFLDLSELRVLDPLVSISLAGGDASVRLDGASNAPMTIMRDPVTGQIRAILREPETTAMWAFALAEAQRFEVLFSRGIPDVEEQRR